MSHLLEQDRTEHFTVVGSPYVSERHDDTRSHYHRYSDEGAHGIGMAAVWLALYAVIIGVTLVGKAGLSQAVETVTAFLR
jgi:hypothetical protein